MPTTVRPLHDHILVQRLDAADKTKGGLFIPENAKERPIEARVIAVGTGKRLENGTIQALDCKPGDRVMFAKYSGAEVKIDGEDMLIMREEDLLAVCQEDVA